jgi:hypothetical protein
MNRRIEAQTRAEYALPGSTMVDAGIAPTGYRVTGRSVVPEEVLGRANVRLEYDQFAGWPPKLAQDTHQQYLAP